MIVILRGTQQAHIVIDYLSHLYATKPYKPIKKLQGNFHSDEEEFAAAKS